MLAENLQQVNANIEKACAAVSRDPGEVTLVAVSKTKPVSMLQEAYDAGARVFGENKVQDVYKRQTMQVPKYAQPGQPFQELEVLLELKVIADVGLVGFPNVGKSTFLSRVTNAKPKIANYHFTTLSPNLGVVDTENGGFIIADIPGLIEGASDVYKRQANI